eukprot:CAMPEP_0201507544 /NCGR_PEP_ID=MMETSP0161_2-20130828/1193_1 /ASSEMBLY_ACC=CAM_ASM_000251 /TAXON_ID=180227 /ORGANISM="Neoparamoeba aestuarina, Strain SoJaBio B1-5/56/2" /LENGTH=378 /DNA_ID=CAMNT_0047901951 /DNA_START=83 /DNA_END=1216 /DNA_ORIENTATION=-
MIWVYATSGGMFYAFGGLATDLKTAGDFSQTQINTLGGTCYTAGLSAMLPIAFFASNALRVTFVTLLTFPIIGWGLLVWVMATRPESFQLVMLGFIIACIGDAGAVTPANVLFVTFMEDPLTEDELVRLIWDQAWIQKNAITGFMVLFALSGGLASVVYIYSPGLPQNKLDWFFVGSFVVSCISLVVGTTWIAGVDLVSQRLRRRGRERGLRVVANNGVDDEGPQPWEDRSLLTRWILLLNNLDLWLGFWGLFFLFGPAVNFYNNAGSMMLAMGADEDALGLIYLLFSGGQIVGRIITSSLITKSKSPWGPTVCVILFSVVLFLVSLVLWLDMDLWLIRVFTVLNALVYGSLWTVIFEIPTPGKLLPANFPAETGFNW